MKFPIGKLKHFRTCEADDCNECYEIRKSDWYRKYMGLPVKPLLTEVGN